MKGGSSKCRLGVFAIKRSTTELYPQRLGVFEHGISQTPYPVIKTARLQSTSKTKAFPKTFLMSQ